jgi:hypothetical protein
MFFFCSCRLGAYIQAQKFADLARELECDEGEAAFDERLKKLATAPKPADQKKQD